MPGALRSTRPWACDLTNAVPGAVAAASRVDATRVAGELDDRPAGAPILRLIGPGSRVDTEQMTPEDLRLRNVTYRLFVELGRAPTADEVAAGGGVSPIEVVEGWRRLHQQHALVLDETRAAVLMANPFSAVPTRYRVEAGDRSWWANCAWDAFGVCDVLGGDGRIETVCLDCDAPLVTQVRRTEPDDVEQVFHCLVPARQWWDDIVFT